MVLELDDGMEATLRAGDVDIQNSTRHVGERRERTRGDGDGIVGLLRSGWSAGRRGSGTEKDAEDEWSSES